MASLKEVELLADEGISLTVSKWTLEIQSVSIDGVGKINWVEPEIDHTSPTPIGVACENI